MCLQGFIRVIVSPIFVALSNLPGAHLQHCISNINNNIAQWEIIGNAESSKLKENLTVDDPSASTSAVISPAVAVTADGLTANQASAGCPVSLSSAANFFLPLTDTDSHDGNVPLKHSSTNTRSVALETTVTKPPPPHATVTWRTAVDGAAESNTEGTLTNNPSTSNSSIAGIGSNQSSTKSVIDTNDLNDDSLDNIQNVADITSDSDTVSESSPSAKQASRLYQKNRHNILRNNQQEHQQQQWNSSFNSTATTVANHRVNYDLEDDIDMNASSSTITSSNAVVSPYSSFLWSQIGSGESSKKLRNFLSNKTETASTRTEYDLNVTNQAGVHYNINTGINTEEKRKDADVDARMIGLSDDAVVSNSSSNQYG